ncbi:manganese efflux pump MntP family protein [Dehalogenimonas sp. THU2]|uniref:manganese efflux pump MntP n=1 Tax=Dehalogenimonas sp. THU2 TaxID=3151121 RepID=UPI003218436D
MEFISIFLIALSLSADCFAVSICGRISMGAALDRGRQLKVAGYFGFFQFAMLLGGFLAGSTVVGLIESFDHWVGFFLLLFIGVRMIRESFEKEKEGEAVDISKGKTLLGLSVATSIDSLAVGMTFAFIQVAIVPAAVLVGATSFVVAMAGFALGARLGDIIGKRAELVGGLVLIGIGVKVLVEGLGG